MAFDVRALREILTGLTGRPYPKRVLMRDMAFCKACGCVYVLDMSKSHIDMHQAQLAIFEEVVRLREIVSNLGDLIDGSRR